MWIKRLLTTLVLLTLAHAALAFDRPFPPTAKRGVMSPASPTTIVVDGHLRKLSVAARIYNRDNLIEMPSNLNVSGLVVNYTENAQGEIERIWILTQQEASQRLPRNTN